MKVARYVPQGQTTPHWGLVQDDRIYPLSPLDAAAGPPPAEAGHPSFLSAWLPALAGHAAGAAADLDLLAAPALARASLPLAEVRLLAPVDAQEVWAAGVTYERSREARLDESGGLDFYDRVYTATRPELFFKALPGRVVGSGDAIWVRADSAWSVPEPELAVYFGPDAGDRLRPVGFTLGNDVSARDIEGENPLYLPQAKVYERSCALGPYVELLPGAALDRLTLHILIERGGAAVYDETISTSRIRRRFDELGAWLGRHLRFPAGVVLLTGTGLVPPHDFTLTAGDRVIIRIPDWGTLVNVVEVAPVFGATEQG
jgi:2-dehydro-3-deoxy-D-arabinonate dehydratase